MTTSQPSKQRTEVQNRSLHLYFELIAQRLNDAGYDVQTVIKQVMDVSWSKILVKELLWKRAQEKMLGKKSTTELTTKEIDIVFDQVNRFLAEKFGISEPWPSLDELIFRESLEEKP